ncbi:hypothetical protein CPB85DRAFT_742854 [Mucidula mucida]|nr:hypothetical protein CPB85DRAFT_742854 [Mucidula mucida]
MTENRSNVAMSFGTIVASSNVNSANPLFAPAMYGHNQYSPQPSPMVAGMYPSYSDEGHAVGSPLTRQPSAHTVNSAHTSGPVQYATYPAMPTTGTREEPLPTGDYADLERSSVTPFQAAQYVEIAKRIDSEPPRGLDTPAVEEYMHRRNDSLPPVPPKDPFDDPSSSVKSGSHHLSTASSEVMPHGELDFPVPPSPAHTTSSRYRIDSMPPSLPELKMDLHHSVSSYDFPSSIRGSEDSTLMSTGAKKDIAPSPLANSFSAKPRPETVYDMEDAYGGIN